MSDTTLTLTWRLCDRARVARDRRFDGRLFLRHAGASPRTVAATRRVQRAKTLLDETAMPIAAVAFAAGR